MMAIENKINLVDNVKERIYTHFSTVLDDIERIKHLKVPTELQKEEEIVEHLMSSVVRESETSLVNLLTLAYFCVKYDHSKVKQSVDFEVIGAYSSMTGILNDETEGGEFYSIYKRVVDDLNSPTIAIFQNSFAKKYRLQIGIHLLEELNAKENLISTFRTLIKDGKFSAWGVTYESYLRIEKNLASSGNYGKVFMVIGQKIPRSVKEFLSEYPNTHASFILNGLTTQESAGSRISFYLVKTSYYENSEKLLKKIKEKWGENKESMIWIAPVDILKKQELVIPGIDMLTNPHIKEALNQLSSMESIGGISDRATILSLIAQSTIRIDDILGVLPFNVLCPGMVPSENQFMISNYERVREELNLRTLADLKDKNPEILSRKLLENGDPNYNNEELDTLKFSKPPSRTEIDARFKNLTKIIVGNASKLRKDIEGL